MQKKKNVKNRLISLLLAITLMLGMIPTPSMTAYAAEPTEAEIIQWDKGTQYDYSNNSVTAYYRNDLYLYKAVFSNLQYVKKVRLEANPDNRLLVDLALTNGKSGFLSLKLQGLDPQVLKSQIPKQAGQSISLYSKGENVVDENKPVLTLYCMPINENPVWSKDLWPTLTVTSADGTAKMTLEWPTLQLQRQEVPPKNCLETEVYVFNYSCEIYGKTYTATRNQVTQINGPHDKYYMTSGNTIMRKCRNNCSFSEGIELKLNPSADLHYTGSEIKPLVLETIDKWTSGTPEIVYKNNILVGNASGSVTAGGQTVTVNFTILNGVMNIKKSDYSGAYDGKAHGISIKNYPSGAKVTYSTSANGPYTATNPTYTEKGSYTVYYKVEKEYYDTAKGSASVTISKADNGWTEQPSIEGWTYGEKAKTPNVGKPKFGNASDIKVEYKAANANDDEYSETVPTNAGNYKVRFSLEGTENYAALTKEVDLTIAKVKVTVQADDKSKTYGEKDKELTWKKTSGELVGSEQLVIELEREKGEDAKTYKIKQVKQDGANPNYEITFVEGTYTINKKTIGIVWGNNSFVYDGKEKFPTATATGMEGEDELGLTVAGGKTEAGKDYTATVTEITGVKKDNYQLPSDGSVNKNFEIKKADKMAPAGLSGTDETIEGKKDGTISGVDAAMEYRKDDAETYKEITGAELTNLSDGTYYIRYKETANYEASPEIPITVNKGRKLTVTIPEVQTGYELQADKTELVWEDSLKLNFQLSEGYSKCEEFAVKVNNVPVTLEADGSCILSDIQENITVTVEDVKDVTAPNTEIILAENKWNEFFNSITFGLFFKETQQVEITAEDKGSGLDKIYYYLSTEELSEAQAEALEDEKWIEYKGTFSINPQEEYIIYAKAVDKDQNTKYISSDNGIVVDTIAPAITGIADGETHYGDTSFTVTDKHMAEIKIDGKAVKLADDGKYTISADGQEHTVSSVDKSGNTTAELTIKVITIASLDDSIETITEEQVKSSDKTAIEEVLTLVTSLIDGGKKFTDTEQSQLESIKANAEKLLKKISDIADERNALIASVNVYEMDKVKSDDKAAIEALIVRIEVLLNGNNLTEEEKTELTNLKKEAEAFIQKIDATAAERKDLSDKVGAYDKKTVNSDDKKAIEDLLARLEVLLKGNNLNDEEKNAMTDLKTTAEALAEMIDLTEAEMKDLSEKVGAYDKKTVKSDDKKAIEDLLARIEELLSGNNMNEKEKTTMSNLKTTANELIQKIDEIAAERKDLSEKVGAYDKAKVKSDDKKALEDLLARIDVLLNGNNLNEEEKTAMSNLKTIVEDLIKKIDDTTAERKDLSEKTGAYDKDTVKSVDKKDIEDLIIRIDVLLKENNLNEEEKTAMSNQKTAAEELLKQIENTASAANTKNVEKVKDIKAGNVEIKDRTKLENAKEDLENALEDYKGNLTKEEKEKMKEEIKRIKQMLKTIEKAENIADMINNLPSDITKADAEAVKKAEKAYNELTKKEKSMLKQNAVKKLSNAKIAVEKAEQTGTTAAVKTTAVKNSTTKSTAKSSPATGDNSQIWMWLALLVVSGGGMFGTRVYRRKKSSAK